MFPEFRSGKMRMFAAPVRVEKVNRLLDGLSSDPGYEPGILFRQLFDQIVGDHRPSVSLSGATSGS